MKILIIGACGNMGKRYVSIVRSLGHIPIECDSKLHNDDLWSKEPISNIDKCIIATPIYWHIFWCRWAIKNGIEFLCEKPISKDPEKIRGLSGGYMVNNWAHCFTETEVFKPGSNRIELDYYSHGNDGVWDLIQPFYLSSKFPTVKEDSPIFRCSINGIPCMRETFDNSFVRMVGAFLNGRKELLWNIEDAAKATEKVLKYIEEKKQ